MLAKSFVTTLFVTLALGALSLGVCAFFHSFFPFVVFLGGVGVFVAYTFMDAWVAMGERISKK